MQDPVQVLGLVWGDPGCSGGRRHPWRCVGGRVQQVQSAGPPLTQFFVRFTCPSCLARALVVTMTPEHLWLLGVEVPGAEAVS